jgi:DNA-binding transcriptional MerR regulator
MSSRRPPAAASPVDEGRYRIAAVSALTGIPVPTIRIWELRYAAVQPERSDGNSRLYARADVERLGLLKAVVDAGFQIGTVAGLADAQLRERLQQPDARSARRASAEGVRTPSVVVCGELLAARLTAAWTAAGDFAIAATWPSLAPLADAASTVDGLVVDLPQLAIGDLQALRRARAALRPQVTVVIYGYATRRTLQQLADEGVIALGAPSDAAHLAQVLRLGLAAEAGAPTPIERLLREPAAARRYDLAFLGSLRELPTQVQCECPNHLADLLERLHAFEAYSLACESRNQDDARLHARLHAATSRCREVLEHVLGEVLDQEGIAQPVPVRLAGETGSAAAP